MKNESTISKVLDNFINAYTLKDINTLISLFYNKPGIVFIGTGSDERCLGLESIKSQFKRDFSQADKITLSKLWECISINDNFAWLAAQVNFKTQIKNKTKDFLTRMTGILEFDNNTNEWKFVHIHLSLPPTEQKVGESFPSCDLY